MSLFDKIFGTYSERELKRIYPIADEVMALEPEMAKLSDAETELSNTKEKLAVAENRAQDAEAENARLKALLAAHGIQDQGEA